MAIRAEVEGLGVLEFPDGTDPAVIQRTVKKQIAAKAGFQQEKFEPASDTQNFLAGVGKVPVDALRATQQMPSWTDVASIRGIKAPSKPVPQLSQAEVDEARRLDAPLMDTKAGFGGNVVGNLATVAIPGGNTAAGATAIGAAIAALKPTDEGESRMQNAAIGGGAALAGVGLAKGLGWLKDKAATKAAEIAAKVQAKSAEVAAAETASARSLAGRTAQDAYKQLEHIRTLNAEGTLSPEQAAIFKSLSEELAGKAQDKLIPAAVLKKEAAQAYVEALQTEAERAAKLAAEKLSGAEAKGQFMARLKRYGPAAVGGALGHAVLPGLGAPMGAAVGLTLRPAIHSMRRLAQNPAVQYQMLQSIGNPGLLGGVVTSPRMMGLLGPSIYAAQQ